MPFTNHAIAVHVRLLDARARLSRRLSDERGAVAIEYVIVAVALLAIAGAIAAALTTLGNDAVEQIPDSVSNTGG
ncbi:MAG: Flp family type IVb pilin [Actinomycetota bacterium]